MDLCVYIVWSMWSSKFCNWQAKDPWDKCVNSSLKAGKTQENSMFLFNPEDKNKTKQKFPFTVISLFGEKGLEGHM